MKKISLLVFGLILISSVSAQSFKEKIAFGGGLSYGTEIENIGINIRGLYEVTEEIHGLMNFIFFFPKKEDFGVFEYKWNLWELNFDGHYNFKLSDKFSAYGLAGINISSWRAKWEGDYGYPYGGYYEDSNTETKIGFNIGGGAAYNFTEALSGFGEIKYILIDSNYDQAVFTFGVLYHL